MKPTTKNPDGELQELHHEAQPGYLTGFWIVFAVTSLVLVIAILIGTDVSTQH